MEKSTLKILEEIRMERERKSKLTREDLEREYDELVESGYSLRKLLDFESNLAESNQIKYHYEITLEDMKKEKKMRLNIDDSFARRGKQGWNFLLPLLDGKDESETVYITRLMALCIIRYNESETICERQKLAPYILRCTNLASPELRRMALITLGWIYSPEHLESELDCLHNHLKNDDDSLCRAWSASALMQLYFHGAPVETVNERSLSVLIDCLKEETDVFATGVIISTVQELWKKKFRLSDAAVERRDAVAVARARKSALRYLECVAEENATDL